MTALEARKLAEESKINAILGAINESAKKGRTKLDLFSIDTIVGNDDNSYLWLFRIFVYSDNELSQLRGLGYKITEILDYKKKVFHEVSWD